ncbi:MATE family efflux transporter [uncultured Tateyamaria sp.]|uniref:MATE family efflux transporter n=1 Tax=uncultured Tateyamaria sp. TaxID=455651 RepID=UPI00260837EC|nr:MATE family efflux transporter [uncultured Tateyamaria sp.]
MSTTPMSYPAHARASLVLGLPLIGGHLGQVAIGVTDTMMLGWYGVPELAALTAAGSWFFVLYLMGSGFAWAVMPMVAAFHAEGDETRVRRATRMGLWLSLAFAVLSMPLMLWSEPILLALGQTPTVAALGSEYLMIAGWGIFPALIVMTLKSYLAALERTQIVFWITALAAVVNAFANYVLIFGYFGAPEMGITGAALASVATQMVMLLGVLVYAVWVLPEHSLFQRLWRADWDMFGQVFRLGWPIGLTSLSEVGLFAASAFMMGWLGEVPQAAHGIALQLASITFMVHLGLSNVATIRAGNALGRHDLPHMVRGAWTVTALSVAMALATIVLFVAVPEPLVSLFIGRDVDARAEILSIGVVLLALAALFQLVDGAQVIALGLLRGVQDTRVPMVLAGVSYWLIGMPVSYVLGFVLGWEGVGVWLGLVFGLACAGVALMLRFWTVSVPALQRAAGSDAVSTP